MKACPQCRSRYPADATYCFVDGATLDAAKDPLIGTTLAGRYVVGDRLGEGGMATVYRARYKLVERPCAIKVLNPALTTDVSVRERFRREAKSAQALSHPNVIEIFDQGECEDGTPFIVMELLEGSTLSTLIARGPVPFGRVLPLSIQIARGIARAHDLGIVHRDLKPDNVFVCQREDGSDLVKILDFGIARSRSDSRLTHAGELFGTPEYMAPERIASGESGPSVDLYALGVIFFEMTTGELPFEADDAPSYFLKHINEKPPFPRSLNPRIPRELEALVLRLLEKDAGARPVDAHRVEKDLTALARASGVRTPPEPEVDPASSLPVARTRPGIAISDWWRRLEIFERMLARAYGARPPGDASRALERLQALAAEFADLRTESTREQRSLEDLDARGREVRQRFGFAVDATGLDASRAKDEARDARLRLEGALGRSRGRGAAYVELQRELLSWEGRAAQSEPYRQLAEAHRACADSIDLWGIARAEERAAQRAAEERDRTVTDLEYQLAELRTALAKSEQGQDRDRDAAQRRVMDLNVRAERMELTMLELASVLCEPLRNRPELGELLASLEATG